MPLSQPPLCLLLALGTYAILGDTPKRGLILLLVPGSQGSSCHLRSCAVSIYAHRGIPLTHFAFLFSFRLTLRDF